MQEAVDRPAEARGGGGDECVVSSTSTTPATTARPRRVSSASSPRRQRCSSPLQRQASSLESDDSETTARSSNNAVKVEQQAADRQVSVEEEQREEQRKELEQTVRVFGLNPRANPRRQSRQMTAKRAVESRELNASQQQQQQPQTVSPNSELAKVQDGKSEIQQIKPIEDKSQQATTPRRMQFFVHPPKQISTSKSYAVSYAKSRMYDNNNANNKRQTTTQPQLNGSATTLQCSSLLASSDNNLTIPASILQGYKPPRQISVSDARARWEASEPFSKCRSRRLLTAKQQIQRSQGGPSGKSSPLSLWSATSVVDQKLQLQQALAASSAAPKPASPSQKDPTVKLLARGSVLERISKFERPSLPVELASSVVAAAGVDELPDDEKRGASGEATGEFATAELTIAPPASASSRGGVARRRSLSSLPSTPITATSTVSSKKQLAGKLGAAGRALSLQSSSSSAQQQRSASCSQSSMFIPRFYLAPEKCQPNTYEMEHCKQSIIACFNQLPDRRASLLAPVWRKNFQLIAEACNLSNYFKDALYRFVKQKLDFNGDNNNNNVSKRTTQALRKASNTKSVDSKDCDDSKENGLCDSQARPSLQPGRTLQRRNSLAVVTESQFKLPSSQLTDLKNSSTLKLQKAASLDSSTKTTTTPAYLSCDQFLAIWMAVLRCATDRVARIVHLLTFGERRYLLPDDLVPLIQSIIDEHPGLKFLRQAPDFHMRYIQTVIARIYFTCNQNWTEKLTMRELRHGNLIQVLDSLSNETDINNSADYFSYEHFYVIYCKFWALDKDHDLYISKQDLAKHQNESISSKILDRIFEGIVSPLANSMIKLTGKMSYPEFVWFLYAEEDKKHPKSIEYWFRLMDIDGDGFISLFEMEIFYNEQVRKLKAMNIEALFFHDSICQILDFINPQFVNKVSLADLKRSKMSTIFFDTFVNLEKYLEHETGDFGSSSRDLVVNGRVVSDFERFCNYEYQSLVSSEETTV